MKKLAIALLLLALIGVSAGGMSAQASSTPSATLMSQPGMGMLTVFADPLSRFTVWDTAPGGSQYCAYAGQVGPSGMTSVMIPLSHYGYALTVVVTDLNGQNPVNLIVVKDERWIWD